MSSHLLLSLTLGYKRGISAVPRDPQRQLRGTRPDKLELAKDLHQLKELTQRPVRRPAGLNSPATRSLRASSCGKSNRSTQTGRWSQTASSKSADNLVPVCFPNCASICLGSRVSFDLPLALQNFGPGLHGPPTFNTYVVIVTRGKERAGIAADSHPAGTPEATGATAPLTTRAWSTGERRRVGRNGLICPQESPVWWYTESGELRVAREEWPVTSGQ